MTDGLLTVAVLGAAGTIAPAIVHDLAQSEEVVSMSLLDLDPDKAAAVAEQHGAGKATAAGIDARDVDALAGAIRDAGAGVLLNTASYRINLEAMRASLKAGCHYLDLGGLYRTTLRQLELSAEFERAGRLAVLGDRVEPGQDQPDGGRGGAAPGRCGRGPGGHRLARRVRRRPRPGGPERRRLALPTRSRRCSTSSRSSRWCCATAVRRRSRRSAPAASSSTASRSVPPRPSTRFTPSWPRSARASAAGAPSFRCRSRRRCSSA